VGLLEAEMSEKQSIIQRPIHVSWLGSEWILVQVEGGVQERFYLPGLMAECVNHLDDVKNSLDITESGNVLDARQGKILHEAILLREFVANKVSTFQATPDDSHYASEKLVKDSLDALDVRIDNIIASSGTSSSEVVDARVSAVSGLYTVLKNRLDAMETTERDNHQVTIDGTVYKTSLIIEDGHAGIRFTEVI
jgi:hypothetical protein